MTELGLKICDSSCFESHRVKNTGMTTAIVNVVNEKVSVGIVSITITYGKLSTISSSLDRPP
jgi:hypothetical protein